jgi:hypothetical protein
MNGTNDCIAYINKLSTIGTNSSPATVLISAQAAGYANTTYYFDDGSTSSTRPIDAAGFQAQQGVIQNGATSIVYSNNDDAGTLAGHITNGVNVAGYLSHGFHSGLGDFFATNGYVRFATNSAWYAVETIESFNGQRIHVPVSGSKFLEWFAPGGFGGSNYSSTPIAAVSHTDEPGGGGPNDPAAFFGLWQSGKSSAISAWNSRRTPYFQAVGDPFVTK